MRVVMLALVMAGCGGSAGEAGHSEPAWVPYRVVELHASAGVGCLRTVDGCGLLPPDAAPSAVPVQLLANTGPIQVLRRDGSTDDCPVATAVCP